MISWLWLIPAVFFAFMGGLVITSILASGKLADLEQANAYLRAVVKSEKAKVKAITGCDDDEIDFNTNN